MQMSVHITDVLVGFAKQDQRHAGLRDAKDLGYLALRHGAAEFSDGDDLVIVEHLLEECNSSISDGMALVGAVIHPFQVVGEAVRLHTVHVIDHGQILGIGNECHRYDAMEEEMLTPPILPHAELSIAGLGMDIRSENLPINRSGFYAVADAVQTSDATKIADFIAVAKICDRNGSPFFNADDIHVAGCLSGYDGLAIKDPPRAPTFGGSAIMASGSITYNRSIPCQ